MKIKKITVILAASAALLLLLAAANLFVSANLNLQIKKKVAAEEKKNRPAEIKITIISEKNCERCLDPAPYLNQIKEQSVNIVDLKNLTRNDEQTRELLQKFEITKLPTLVFSGEIDKNTVLKNLLEKRGRRVEEVIVWQELGAPYFDLSDSQIKGLLSLTIIDDQSCEQCYDPNIHKNILRGLGVNNPQSQTYDLNSQLGAELVKRYDINLLPTFIISGDYQKYPNLLAVWPKVGTKEENTLIFREGVKTMGAYKEINSGKIITADKENSTVSYNNLTPTEFQQLSDASDTIILDVRTEQEYETTHLEGAKLMPLDQLPERLSELDKNKKILVYCRSGNRSAEASRILTKNGFTNVYNLEKGILEWQKEGLPVVK